MPDFDSFYEQFVTKGLEYFRLYYGLYRGFVMRNDDPEKRGRVQVRCPVLGHNQVVAVWVDPIFEGAGSNRGSFFPPEVGDSVRVFFERGRSDKPVAYFGGWHSRNDLPAEFAYTEGVQVGSGTGPVPERRGWVTRKGNRLVFSDVAGSEAVELAWHRPAPTDAAVTADSNGDRSKAADRSHGETSRLFFDAEGGVLLENQNGALVRLSASDGAIVIQDEHGTKITLNGSQVLVEAPKVVLKSPAVELADGADTFAPRGTELMQWLATHTHGTGMGPSSPPLQPPPNTILSRNVRLK